MTNGKTPERRLNSVCVCFVVEDVVKSAEYYRDVGLFVQPVLGRAALLCDAGTR